MTVYKDPIDPQPVSPPSNGRPSPAFIGDDLEARMTEAMGRSRLGHPPLMVKVVRISRRTELYECPRCWALTTKIVEHVKASHPYYNEGSGVLAIPKELL